ANAPGAPLAAVSAAPASPGGGSAAAAPSSSQPQLPELEVSPSPAASPASSAPGSAVPGGAPDAPVPEINTRTAPVALQSHANLVPVRVVVHDATGHAVEGLRKEDFQVRQDGKVQFITHFAVEIPGAQQSQLASAEAIAPPTDSTANSSAATNAGRAAKPAPGTGAPGKLTMPTHFVAMLFDDAHLSVGDLTRAKLAALKFIATSVKPNERLALFTMSGRSQVDFTDDLEKVRNSLRNLIRTPIGAFDPEFEHDCLQITYYQADLIQNQNDQQALAAALSDAAACASSATTAQQQAQEAAMTVSSTVTQVLQAGYLNTQYAVMRLQEVVRRVAALPGQRSIVLVSPGFLTPTFEYDVSEIIDRANHTNVFINSLDARGLYTVDPLGDVSQEIPVRASPATTGLSLQYRTAQEFEQSQVLSELAYGTGGFYFRNNNDLDAGFRITAGEPEVSYLLAFVPENLKNDGKFHALSVKLLIKEKYTVQARRGFYAPKRGVTPEQLAQQDIEDALFSQEEQQGVPVQLHLQYYKTDPGNAKLSVLAHVDLNHVGFEKAQGRNWDDLTIVTALFDRNGNFITGMEKTLELRLKDATLERLDQTGVTLNTNFDVKPGGYLVRLVVRDKRAAQLSARNGVVEIP
ncbi:MAG: VWA domain-containing protein, partial [Candidatus Acidiferrales bacterium]